MRQTPESIYHRFVNFEEQAAEIYLQMASRFCPENQDLSSLWFDMGMQEKQHAGLLQFCIAEGLFASPLATDAEIEKVENLFKSLKKRAADPALSIPDAFQIAAEMETSEVNDIYCHLTSPMHSSMYLLRRKIATSMPDHIGHLLREGRKFGIRPETLKALERVTDQCAGES